MAKSASIPIRLEDETITRIDSAAKSLGIPRSVLIRMLVERFVDAYERNGDRIMMPIQVVGADEVERSYLLAAEKPATYGAKKKPAKAKA